MSQHKYYSLSDDEFLRLIQQQCHQSPLIEELCRRLECTLDNAIMTFEDVLDSAAMLNDSLAAKGKVLQCPTCEAPLKLNILPEEDYLELQFKD